MNLLEIEELEGLAAPTWQDVAAGYIAVAVGVLTVAAIVGGEALVIT